MVNMEISNVMRTLCSVCCGFESHQELTCVLYSPMLVTNSTQQAERLMT